MVCPCEYSRLRRRLPIASSTDARSAVIRRSKYCAMHYGSGRCRLEDPKPQRRCAASVMCSSRISPLRVSCWVLTSPGKALLQQGSHGGGRLHESAGAYMIAGIGVDLVDIADFSGTLARGGEAYVDRVFTARERLYC